MKGSLTVLAIFILGMGAAYLGLLPKQMQESDVGSYALYFLMFMVGFSIGIDQHAISAIRNVSYKIILVPLAIVIGTIAGSFIVSFIVKAIDTRNVLAIGSGFGYYSLSSIFIGKISGSELGVVALLSNMIREISTLLLIPLYVRHFGKLSPIAAAGATSMDTCLPLIMKHAGKEMVVVAIFSGIALTTIVPFLVVFILSV